MPAFEDNDSPYTNTFNYFRKQAIALDCDPNFDQQESELIEMNKKGRDGVPGCLCTATYVPCPCVKGKRDVEEKGICHCEIFRRKAV